MTFLYNGVDPLIDIYLYTSSLCMKKDSLVFSCRSLHCLPLIELLILFIHHTTERSSYIGLTAWF